MKLRHFLAGVMLAALALPVAAQQPIVIKFSHVVAVDTPKGKGAERFNWAERVKRSGERKGSKVTGIGVGQAYHPAGFANFDGLCRITPDGKITEFKDGITGNSKDEERDQAALSSATPPVDRPVPTAAENTASQNRGSAEVGSERQS